MLIHWSSQKSLTTVSFQVLLRSNRVDALLSRLLPHGQLLFLNHRFAQSLEKEVAAYMAKWTQPVPRHLSVLWLPLWDQLQITMKFSPSNTLLFTLGDIFFLRQ